MLLTWKISEIDSQAKKYLAEKESLKRKHTYYDFCSMHNIPKWEDKSNMDGVATCRKCAKDLMLDN